MPESGITKDSEKQPTQNNMAKYKLEYLWLDGYTPVANIRGKTKIAEYDEFPTLDQLPMWGFDGSSTLQAEGGDSDCMLKPVVSILTLVDPATQHL